jgi:hypothetical protein
MILPVEKALQKVLKERSDKFDNDPDIIEYQNAVQEFEKLVQMGVAKHRGYTLSTIESSPSRYIKVNSQDNNSQNFA